MRNAITDVAGLRVGNAEHPAARTGVTVVTADAPFTAGVHVMGGAPGTRETELLAPDKLVQQVDALVLSGGSAFGLAAADGVMEALRSRGRGFRLGDQIVPIVPAAILFDLTNGGDKSWSTSPYHRLGQDALETADVAFEIGTAGAGFGATTATLKGGLGTASAKATSGANMGALVAVNAVGTACTSKGHFWAAPWEQSGEFGGRGVDQAPAPAHLQTKLTGRATTIAIVATDAPLTQAQCTRLATAAHDGIARALIPAHTPFDGDLVFAASTGAGAPVEDLALMELGHLAATTLARAIARGIYEATHAEGDLLPCWREACGEDDGDSRR